jgi:hypothetical protein
LVVGGCSLDQRAFARAIGGCGPLDTKAACGRTPRSARSNDHSRWDTVFISWQVREVGRQDEEKLIGVCGTHSDAEAAIARLRDKPGFREEAETDGTEGVIASRPSWFHAANY